jgi:hypothetical protein
MPVVDESTLGTLSSAAQTPTDYAIGAERQELKAAFDIACSQIAKAAFGFESQNRMMLRQKLNHPDLAVPEAFKKLIYLLKKALAKAEPLYSSNVYDEEGNEIVKFVEAALRPLVECLQEFQ